MSAKSLLSLATVLCFGIVGCDDPEVGEKVADILQYGVVTAELKCSSVNHVMCPSSNQYTDVIVYKYLDGSTSLQVGMQGGAGVANIFQYCPKGQPVKAYGKHTGQSDVQFDLNTNTGELQLFMDCHSGPPYEDTDVTDLNSASCTGRNTEAFGVTP